MTFKPSLPTRLCLAAIPLAVLSTSALAGPVGYGAGTTGGGSKAAVNVATLAAAQAAIDSYSGSGGLVLNYTGTFNFASITDVCAQWKKPAQTLLIKDKGDITIKGANGSSANFGIRILSDAKNVIVQNMTIGLLQGGEDADAISIEGDSSGTPNKIWIDHNTLFSSLTHCAGAGDASWDGAMDNKKGATNITYSYNYIHDHQKVALNGYSDKDTANDAMRATYHHNRFENVNSRLPLFRGGTGHIFNNFYSGVESTAINSRLGACLLIENNVFNDVLNPWVSAYSDTLGGGEVSCNVLSGSSSFVYSSDTFELPTCNASVPYDYQNVLNDPASVESIVKANAGVGKLQDPKVF